VSAERFLMAAFAGLLLAGQSAGSAHAEAGGAISGGSGEVTSWVVGAGPGGGVRQPLGSTCTLWGRASDSAAGDPATPLAVSRLDAAGASWNLFSRSCDGQAQFVWVPVLPAADLGQLAFDEVTKKLPKPSPSLSPDSAIGGYVNFETWLSVTDPGLVTATSAIPGLSATATARVVRIEWRPGDGSLVTCDPFGGLPPSPGYTGTAPCGYTFTKPSVARVTGTSDGRFHGSVTLVWAASWTASNGASGDLGETKSTVAFVYRVREIQTIGAGG
jgi:hypothetical protein